MNDKSKADKKERKSKTPEEIFQAIVRGDILVINTGRHQKLKEVKK